MGRPRKHNRQLPDRMYIRSGTYYYVEYVTNKWVNLGREYVAAMAKYGSLTADDSPSLTVSNLIDRYIREVAPTKAPRTYSDNVKEAKNLRRVFGHMPLLDVTTPHVYKYLAERGKQARVRANREIALLTHMFKKAERWGDISHDKNPCIRIEKPKETPRSRYVSDEEYLAFRDHAGPMIAAYMDVKYVTALRQGDLLALSLNQIRDDGIHVTIGKTGKKVVFEWSPDLRAAILAVRRVQRPIRGMYLFCNRRGQPYTGSGFRSIWQRRMKSALEKGVLRERFREHDLRAKSASDAERGHASELLTHMDARTTETYYRRKPEIVLPITKVLED